MDFNKTLKDYVGSISQVGGLKRYCLTEGRAKGVDVVEFNNGAGIVFDVILDRGMDICRFCYKGLPVSFISRTGIASSSTYDSKGYEWLKSFFAGLFTTCGLFNAGEPSEYGGRHYGLHGDYSYTPAENICIKQGWEGDTYRMSLDGQVRQGMFLFGDVVVNRSIFCELGKNEVLIRDVIINEGTKKEPFMLAYHFNFGYPLLNKKSKLLIPVGEITAFSEESEQLLKDWDKFAGPESATEAAYFHKMRKDSSGRTSFLVADNAEQPFYAFELEYDANILGLCMQWRHFTKGEYCLSMQPTNSYLKGAAAEEENKTLKYINPGQVIENLMKLKVYSSADEIKRAEKKIMSI